MGDAAAFGNLEADREGEMEAHLQESESPNRRNGKATKTVLNEFMDQKILALFALGRSCADISEHQVGMYGLDVSSAAISSVTGRFLPEISVVAKRWFDIC